MHFIYPAVCCVDFWGRSELEDSSNINTLILHCPVWGFIVWNWKADLTSGYKKIKSKKRVWSSSSAAPVGAMETHSSETCNFLMDNHEQSFFLSVLLLFIPSHNFLQHLFLCSLTFVIYYTASSHFLFYICFYCFTFLFFPCLHLNGQIKSYVRKGKKVPIDFTKRAILSLHSIWLGKN